jgi:uncharacterized protein
VTFDAVLTALGTVPGELAAYSLAVVFLGYVVLGVSGFGSALTIVPLLALRWPLFTVVPLVLLLDLPATLLLTRLNAKQIDWRELALLVPGLIAGAALGAWLAHWTAQPWALALLGAYVIGVALRGLFVRAAPARASARWAPLAGAAAGVVESLFGTSGPLIVAWLARRFDDGTVLRANVPPALAAVTCCALVGMAVTGQLAQPLLWGALPVAICVALAGTALGHRVGARLPARLAARLIFALLALAGAAMLLRAALLAA